MCAWVRVPFQDMHTMLRTILLACRPMSKNKVIAASVPSYKRFHHSISTESFLPLEATPLSGWNSWSSRHTTAILAVRLLLLKKVSLILTIACASSEKWSFSNQYIFPRSWNTFLYFTIFFIFVDTDYELNLYEIRIFFVDILNVL